MKIKMSVIYGDEICEALKEDFGCDTAEELFGVFKCVMKTAFEAEVRDTDGIDIKCELIN